MSDRVKGFGICAFIAFIVSQLDILGLLYDFSDLVGGLFGEFIYSMKMHYPQYSEVVAPATFIFVLILVLYLVRE